MLNACLDKRLFPPAPIWSTILLLLSANAVAGAPLHANDDGTSSSSVCVFDVCVCVMWWFGKGGLWMLMSSFLF